MRFFPIMKRSIVIKEYNCQTPDLINLDISKIYVILENTEDQNLF